MELGDAARGLQAGRRSESWNVRMTASILCPVDFSEESLTTLRRAAMMAERSAARLAALHVADPLLVRAAAAACHVDVVVRESARALHDALDRIRRTDAGGVTMSAHVVVGDPAPEICRFCGEHDIDLIVMASHTLKGPRRLVAGSVAERVLSCAPVPILVFPARPTGRASTMQTLLRLDDAATSHA
jgi:nucleotide-binding universal stress UspA family protein